jgi:hypothetical protein
MMLPAHIRSAFAQSNGTYGSSRALDCLGPSQCEPMAVK